MATYKLTPPWERKQPNERFGTDTHHTAIGEQASSRRHGERAANPNPAGSTHNDGRRIRSFDIGGERRSGHLSGSNLYDGKARPSCLYLAA
jgi:hypothetical protein